MRKDRLCGDVVGRSPCPGVGMRHIRSREDANVQRLLLRETTIVARVNPRELCERPLVDGVEGGIRYHRE